MQLTEKTKLKSYKLHGIIKLMRIKQWTKNLFVFAAVLFSRNIFRPELLLKSLYTFACFCLISSAVYILNDLADIENDRNHPFKKNRPLAAGIINPAEAVIFSAALLTGGTALSFHLDRNLGIVVLIYLINNLMYTLYLKHHVILDVVSISIGFLLRVMAGALIIHVAISEWLLLCTVLLSLFLGFSKRRCELVMLDVEAHKHRKILSQYSVQFIDKLLSMITTSTLISYLLYTFFEHKGQLFMITALPVLYGIFRYQYLIYQEGKTDNPDELVLSDKPLFLSIAVWVISIIGTLYIANPK